MNVRFACPRCEQSANCWFTADSAELLCPECGARFAIPRDALREGRLHRCLVCPSRDLFIRKDFPQRLGVAIVVLGFLASSIAWYFYQIVLTFAILFGTALLDVALYLLVGGVLVCYRCQAQYRGIESSDEHGGFELETHERYRQQAARLAERSGRQYHPLER
jgi:DNA-directed RNA polymerase subunit RPC12/RpoP